jgi:hypothetical protein
LNLSRHPSRKLHMRLAMVALFAVGVALVAPSAALARDGQIKLALLPIGQPGPYFDLTMEPGASRDLAVNIANDGEGVIAARTYAADVYTIINGGFGGRLRDEPQTGMTGWIDYPTDVLRLTSGEGINRSFTVAVPVDATPGEYITSIVLENDQPILGDGAVGLNQIIRQAVAVVVTVPGRRSPELVIGAAAHKVVAGMSIVQVAVRNTGNVRLKPIVGFTLVDSGGTQISHASVPMDTFYAHTDTFVEVPLAAILPPGTYEVGLTVDDADQGVLTSSAAIALVVEAPVEAGDGAGVVPGLIDVIAGAGATSFAVLGIVLAAGTLFAVGAAWIVLRRRRHRMGPGQ